MKRMRSKACSAILAIVLLLQLLPFSAFAEEEPFNGGVGTSSDPYQISTPADLEELADRVNGTNGYTADSFPDKYFELTNDIILGYWNDADNDEVVVANEIYKDSSFNTLIANSNHTAIGSDVTHPFAGIFDGDNHTVSGLYIYESAGSQGLFGDVVGGAIKNLRVTDSYINGGVYTGGVAGGIYNNSTISNCDFSGNVTEASGGIGGISGQSYGSTITNCDNSGTVNGTTDCAAGVVGVVRGNSTISNCVNSGAVNSIGDYVGGIAGDFWDSTITGCTNSGTIKGDDFICGISGWSNPLATVQCCIQAQ